MNKMSQPPTIRTYVVGTLLFMVSQQLLLGIYATIHDNKPINVYTQKKTGSYPTFTGEGSDPSLSLTHIQGMQKIGNYFCIFAKDYIFTVDLKLVTESHFNYTHVLKWASMEEAVTLCRHKGIDAEKCHNYIKMVSKVQTIERGAIKLVTCATGSFQPICKYIKMTNEGSLIDLGEQFRGALTCPYDPTRSYASLLLEDGHWYTATEASFSGHDSLLHRSNLLNNNELRLRTEQSQASWFKDPEFIRLIEASEHLNKIYLMFKETAIEDNSYQTYSRLGQACKGDVGGKSVLRNKFTTFFKVRLNCSLPGQPPFYFNEIVDSSDLVPVYTGNGTRNVIFTVMNSPRNSVPASALCVYTEDDIETALTGDFLEKYTDENYVSYWGKQDVYPKPHPARCDNPPFPRSDVDLTFIRKHPMMFHDVAAWDLRNHTGHHNSLPVYTRMTERNFLTTLAVDVLTGWRRTVVVMGTEDGKIIKLLIDEKQNVVVVEERVVFNGEKCLNGNKSIRKIVIDIESGRILVNFDRCVVAAPLCPLHNTCSESACTVARDPYCRWSRRHEQCMYSHPLSTTFIHTDTSPCKAIVAVSTKPEATKPQTILNDSIPINTTTSNNTVMVPLPSSEPGTMLFASSNMTMLIILALGMFVAGFIIASSICCYWISRAKKGKEPVMGNFKMTNGGNHIQKESTFHSREKTPEKKSRSRQSSGNRNSGPRGNDYISGNRSDEEVFDQSEATQDQPTNHRQKKLMSSGSNHSGRQTGRSTKHSTGSNGVEHQDSPTQPFFESQYERQLSNESGHSLDMTVPLDNDAFGPSSPHKRVPPSRSTSFPGPPMFRTYSMDQPGTMGHPRPNRHPVGRQHSLQAPRSAHQPIYIQQPMGQLHPQQTMPNPANGGQGWIPVVQTPNRQIQNGKAFDPQARTYSLDRRRMQKGQNGYPKDGQVLATGTPNGYSMPHQRKRYVSEPGKGGIPTSHIQLSQPTQYQSIQEEQEPFMPNNGDNESRRKEHLSLQVFPVYEQDPSTFAPTTAANTAPAMIHDQLEPLFAKPTRPYPGRFATQSNPGTPMREIPPQMFDDAEQYARHTTLPNKPKPKLVPTQHMQQIMNRERPHVLNLDESFQATAQSKSSPAVTPSDGRMSFPNSQRSRHSSGKTQVTPSSPVKSVAPVSFANHHPSNGHAVLKPRNPSGENP